MYSETSRLKVLLIYRRYSSSFTAYPWILARSGRVSVDVIAPRGHRIRHSRWTNKCIIVEQDEDFVSRLLETMGSRDYDAVLGVDEPSRTLLLEHRNLEELNAYLPFKPGSNLHEVAVNKIQFQNWCKQLGINCPRSVYLKNGSDVAEAARQFDFPFILKGALGAGGMCVDRINSAEDLKCVLQKNPERSDWILQEFVEGDVGTTGFVAGDKGLYALCSVSNLVCMGNGMGPSQIGCFEANDRLRDIALKMTADGGVRGMTGFDWIKTSDGNYMVIDPHFGRVVPNMVVAHLDGVDLGEAYADYILDRPAQLREGKGAKIVYWLFPQS